MDRLPVFVDHANVATYATISGPGVLPPEIDFAPTVALCPSLLESTWTGRNTDAFGMPHRTSRRHATDAERGGLHMTHVRAAETRALAPQSQQMRIHGSQASGSVRAAYTYQITTMMAGNREWTADNRRIATYTTDFEPSSHAPVLWRTRAATTGGRQFDRDGV